ncbi:hypothetical protein B0A48_16519 [Cryoendolithus antarcticus]|uniref:DOC domain-containing protein n=1 Tax=Cryoendolithus antarcticus TaxID=1507870 RepID=A0A1V8SEU0_9PEZI|nr:hypothetical protein B0A48_16519 [Cryoendolithus antarcticus]
MPPSTRRQARQRLSEASAATSQSEELPTHAILEDHPHEVVLDLDAADDEDMEGEDEEGDDGMHDGDQHREQGAQPPPGLKEISSLASWTVTTAKPGNGVAALRNPDLNQFWQSDGPQPHLLSIHFFKLVSIAHMRVFLDFESDESYTPTKIQFLAGMGAHDIQEFSEMSFEQPTGWIDVDFSNIGPVEHDEDEENQPMDQREIDWSKRPTLRAFLVQLRILENHQNGKDTHLRAVQIFARDETHGAQRRGNVLGVRSANALPVRTARGKMDRPRKQSNNIRMAEWMMEPDLR